MYKIGKVDIILVFIAFCAIIITIFALSITPISNSPTYSDKEYEENIRALNDIILELKEDIAKYEVEIERIDLKRSEIKKELELIIKNNEKIDAELSNGDWDYNIRFLTDYISEKDSVDR